MTAPHQSLLGISGAVDTGEETDPNFNQTVLLLHGDGTNGGQNNTFVDSSSTGHTITRNGNPTQGTFNPFLGDGQYGVFFGPSNDDLEFANFNGSAFTNDGVFCVELFVTKTILGNTTIFFSSDTNDRIQVFMDTSNNFGFSLTGNSTTTFLVPSGISAGVFNHFCITRDSSNNVRGFINGVLKAYKTNITTSQELTDLHVGSQKGTNHFHRGAISNVRFVAGSMPTDYNTTETATGTTCFTIPSEPLTLTSQGTTGNDVELLCCQSNRFIDNSNNGITPTVLNTPKVIPLSPFAPTASYSESVHGGSGFFDNNGDYLETATSSSLDFNANQFCIEWWEYRTARSSFDIVMHIGFNGSNSYGLLIGYTGNGIYWSSSGSSWDVLSNANFFGSETRYNNQWYHCVLTRDSSNQFRSFINGVLRYTTSVGSSGIYQAANAIAIGTGQNHTSNHDYAGYLSDINISNGSIPTRYQTSSTTVNTSIFTSPTAPTTSDTDTKLLLNFTNASIIDSTMKNNLETVGDAQIDTSVKKFGTGSIQFDGNDSIRWNQASGTSEQMAIRTGPFTVEFFVYFDGDPNSGGTNARASLIRDGGNSFVIQRYDGEWEVGSEPTPQIQVAQSLSNQTFYHVALTRDSSNNLRLFIDGTQAGSTATSFTTDFDENQWHLGSFNADGSGGRALTGFMDEVRITKSVARYTSDFTAPTKAFANK